MPKAKNPTASEEPAEVVKQPGSDMNQVAIIGRICSPIELRHTTATGKSVCNLRVASNYKGQTNYLTAVCWGKTAEVAARYLTTGRRIALTGTWQSRTWTTPDGDNRESTLLSVQQLTFLDGPRTKEVGA